jgi:hypothetical protein
MAKDVEFDHSRKEWDRYKRFHTLHCRNKLVHFETGELIVTARRFRPDERCRIDSKFGVVFLYPHDQSAYLRMLRDPQTGERIRQSWLDSNQTFMVDTSTGQMVGLDYAAPRNVAGGLPVPASLMSYGPLAYCGGAGMPWVSTGRVRYSKPAKLTKEQKEELAHTLLVVRAQQRTGSILAKHDLPRYRWEEGADKWYIAPVGYKEVLGKTLEDISNYNRAVLASYGYAPFRDATQINEAKVS